MSSVGTTQSALAVGFSFPIIDGILVCLRFYTRQKLKTERQLDDWLCIPAWLCLTGCCASLIAGVYKGAFVDGAPTTQEDVVAQVTAALVILWMGTNFLVKLIMLCFYRRIFVGRAFNICNWALIGLSVVWFVYAILSWLFYCGINFKENLEGGWSACPTWGFEIQMGVFALDSFIDFFLLAMPIPFVWRLHLDFKRKIAISVVFILGGFAFVAGLNNTIIQLVNLTQPELTESGSGANFFQGSSLLFSNWPTIEIGVGLLASNLPHLSFRLGRAIKQSLPRALRVSLDSIRHAAAALSLSSGRHHPYDQGSGQRSGDEARDKKGESVQGLRPGTGQGKWVDAAKRSDEQNSSWSGEAIELRDMAVSRTGDDAV
ncbi:uncharacterized protein GGS22DRAFT_71258 [Annulohypoxylon maeteangense]|uniref:uncharacterized protein n=1 Tax=Annulohypoxylon maeteangense TaxID=1927788 RepID=UPI002007727B|nr:uncharacterized protein GGS22DRAFT_71258 [Annulohypoxylon maeteangense]KAI0889451.1 hypothetical protein GGS22DRAFT_71258 [Annulohypoxylon maeteangense]